jgi:hypothetical protein
VSDLRLAGLAWYDHAFARTSAVRDPSLPGVLAAASHVVFERSGICVVGEPTGADVVDCQLRPSTNFYVGRLGLGLAGRTHPVRSRRLRRRAARVWSDGLVLIARDTAWVPADCWTPRIFAEAGHRLFMALCDAERMPEFSLPNHWNLPAGRDGAIAQFRADTEDAAFEDWRLSAKGIEQFAAFGRDPALALP